MWLELAAIAVSGAAILIGFKSGMIAVNGGSVDRADTPVLFWLVMGLAVFIFASGVVLLAWPLGSYRFGGDGRS